MVLTPSKPYSKLESYLFKRGWTRPQIRSMVGLERGRTESIDKARIAEYAEFMKDSYNKMSLHDIERISLGTGISQSIIFNLAKLSGRRVTEMTEEEIKSYVRSTHPKKRAGVKKRFKLK